MAKVVFDHATKKFGDVTAVNNLTLEVHDKEFLVLVGPSGCGKSTALRMLAGLEEISSGAIYIGDRLVNNVPPKDRDIAMVFQNYALYPHMSVYDNMAFGLKLRGRPKAEIEQRVKEAAGILGIQNLLQRKPKQLSGGQRQRVALGRAIVREPQVFLMDEPLSNLDAKLRVQTRTEIIKLHQRIRTTTIYVTHDQVEAMTMGDRIVVLRDGVLQQLDTPQNLYDHPANTFIAGFIGSPAMNFFPVTVTADANGMAISNSTLRLNVPEQYQKRLEKYQDKKVLFGIRPEDIEDAEYLSATREHGQPVVVNIDVLEPLGAEVFLYMSTADGENFVARVDPRTKAKPGTQHNVVFNLDKMHAFDPDTEEAIV